MEIDIEADKELKLEDSLRSENEEYDFRKFEGPFKLIFMNHYYA